MPKVSVVIPTYNQAVLLRESLESVFSQTYKDVEVIVVDDGSTDNTKEIVSAFGNKIRYIRQENKGQAEARNVGIKEARGEYIAFLDHDDIWSPDKLEIQMNYIKNEPATVMICGNGTYFGSLTKEGLPIVRTDWAKRFAKTGISLEDAFSRYYIRTSTLLLRKEAVLFTGGFDDTLRVAEDFDLMLRMLAVYGKIHFIDKPLCKLRKHCGNVSAQDESRRHREVISIIGKLVANYPGSKKVIGLKNINNFLAYHYYKLGKAYIRQNNKMEAVAAFKKALSYRPFYASCLLQYLLCKLSIKQR